MFTLLKRPTVDATSNTPCFHVEGFMECAYFHAAAELATKLEQRTGAKVKIRMFDTKETWQKRLNSLQQRVKGGNQHQTSPMVFKGCEERDWHLIGGYTEFVKYAQSM